MSAITPAARAPKPRMIVPQSVAKSGPVPSHYLRRPSGTVNINVRSFIFSTAGNVTSARPGVYTAWTPEDNYPTCDGFSSYPSLVLRGSPAATCPGGGYDGGGIFCADISFGGCTETYRLTGTFTDANNFAGRFYFTYTPVGLFADCGNCSTHSVPILLSR